MKEKNEINLNSKAKTIKRRTGIIFVSLSITFVIFIVSTYAWFIGTTEVMVNEFEVEVLSSDGLTISLDAVTFSDTVTVGEDEVTTDLETNYPTHKNHWVGEDGLEPISTVGTYDTTNNVAVLFSKASITSQQGGYKLRTARIENYDSNNNIDEKDSYIAFDIFIKNTSGEGYSSTYAPEDAEGIYLSPNSGVALTTAGVGGDGIENSVRVGMFSVGRVEMSAPAAAAQAIDCSTASYTTNGANSSTYVLTPSCGRGIPTTPQGGGDPVDGPGIGITWNIYEPNDTAHTANSISHFSRVCKKKTVSQGTTTYGDPCTAIENGTATPTFAANDTILASDDVNIYDGLNDFTNYSSKLTQMDYYTDTDKNATADNKEELFFLAPNSITKIRIYIYLEGQDVDNYDLGQIGKKILITFGFTKDKFAEATPATPVSP